MKSGRVIMDGQAPQVMLEKEVLESARVAQPEMVSFYAAIRDRPRAPFVDPLEAARWLGVMKPR